MKKKTSEELESPTLNKKKLLMQLSMTALPHNTLSYKQIQCIAEAEKYNLAKLLDIASKHGIRVLYSTDFEHLSDDTLFEIFTEAFKHSKINKVFFYENVNSEKDIKALEKIFLEEDIKLVDPSMLYEEEVEDINTEKKKSLDSEDIDTLGSVQSYFNSVSKFKLLNLEEERRLTKATKEGDKKAREKLIAHNLRLVISIAKKYQNKGLSLIDLIHEGNLGLIKATEKFDPNRGLKFSTYSHWWIQQSVTRAIADKGNIVRIPVHLFELKNKINRYVNSFTWAHGRSPSVTEISEKLSIPEKKIQDVINIKTVFLSIDQKINSSETQTMSELLIDESTQFPFDNFIYEEILNIAKKTIDKLPKREKQIIKLRFNITDLDSDEEVGKIISDMKVNTLDQIGQKLNITRERVRQLEQRAMDTLTQLIKKEIVDSEN